MSGDEGSDGRSGESYGCSGESDERSGGALEPGVAPRRDCTEFILYGVADVQPVDE